MWLGEVIGGIVLFAIAFFMLRVAKPVDGVPPPFMLIRGLKQVYIWGCLLSIYGGGTLVIHSLSFLFVSN